MNDQPEYIRMLMFGIKSYINAGGRQEKDFIRSMQRSQTPVSVFRYDKGKVCRNIVLTTHVF